MRPFPGLKPDGCQSAEPIDGKRLGIDASASRKSPTVETMPVFLKSAHFELLDDHLRAVSRPAPGLPQARDSMVLEQFVSWPPLDSCLGFAEKQPRCRGRRQVDEPESDTHCVELRRRSELA